MISEYVKLLLAYLITALRKTTEKSMQLSDYYTRRVFQVSLFKELSNMAQKENNNMIFLWENSVINRVQETWRII